MASLTVGAHTKGIPKQPRLVEANHQLLLYFYDYHQCTTRQLHHQQGAHMDPVNITEPESRIMTEILW